MSSFSDLSTRWNALSAPVVGALLMTGASVCFAVMNVLIRLAAAELDPAQIAFFRNFFALLFMMPWLLKTGAVSFHTASLKLQLLRGCIGLIAMLCWFTSVAILPLDQAVALNFTVPLFATIAAALILHEVVRARRWTATAIGFLGIVVIARPGAGEITPAMALPIIAAAFMAISIVIVKWLSQRDPPTVIVFYQNLIMTPLSLVPALFFWRWPSALVLTYLVGIGATAVLAHMLLTRAYTKADASAIIPFDYTRLPFIAIGAYLVFGEEPDIWTWVGAAIIAGSSIYIARREAVVARDRKASGAAAESAKGRV